MAGNGDSGNIYRLREDTTTWQDDYHRLSERLTPLQVEYIRNIPDTFGKKRQYIELLLDGNYEDVQYNPENGGLKARHKDHKKTNEKEEIVSNGKTGKEIEIDCQEELYRLGHTAILLGENENIGGKTATCLDAIIDGVIMDIKSFKDTTDKVGNTLLQKNKQIMNYNRKRDVSIGEKRPLCLFFNSKERFQAFDLGNDISWYLDNLNKNNNNRDEINAISKVICVVKGDKTVHEYNVEKKRVG